jgi:hypothetical protein
MYIYQNFSVLYKIILKKTVISDFSYCKISLFQIISFVSITKNTYVVMIPNYLINIGFNKNNIFFVQ